MTFTFGPEGMKLYLNGALVGANGYTGGLVGNREPIVIGGSNATHRNGTSDLSKLKISDPFEGWIDEVAFYGTVLDAEEIAQTRERGAMAVTAPEDANDSFVSIERFVFADPAHASAADASALQGTVFSETALTNTATFFGLCGTIELGTFDGRAPIAPEGAPVWPSLLKQGIDLITQKLQGHEDDGKKSRPDDADWVVLSTSEAKVKDAHEKDRKDDRKADGKAEVRIDWKGALASFGAALLSRGGAAKPAQPNIADFKQPAKGKR
jgi:hypothetical protein